MKLYYVKTVKLVVEAATIPREQNRPELIGPDFCPVDPVHIVKMTIGAS